MSIRFILILLLGCLVQTAWSDDAPPRDITITLTPDGIDVEHTVLDDEELEFVPSAMLLDYISLRDRTHTRIQVPYKLGPVDSPLAGKSFDRIGIRGGDLISSVRRPPDFVIGLYRGRGKQRVLVTRMLLRFFKAGPERWQPYYQPHQEPVIVRQGDRWIPLTTVAGTGGLVLTGGYLPNANGYYKQLEFTLGLNNNHIDSWEMLPIKR